MKRSPNQYVHLLHKHAGCHSHTYSRASHDSMRKNIRNGQRHKRKDHCQIGYLLKRYCTMRRKKKNLMPSFYLSLYIVFLKDYITQTNLLILFSFFLLLCLKGFGKPERIVRNLNETRFLTKYLFFPSTVSLTP